MQDEKLFPLETTVLHQKAQRLVCGRAVFNFAVRKMKMGDDISSLAMLMSIRRTWFLCIPVIIKDLIFIKPVVSKHSQQDTYLRSGFFWLNVVQ